MHGLKNNRLFHKICSEENACRKVRVKKSTEVGVDAFYLDPSLSATTTTEIFGQGHAHCLLVQSRALTHSTWISMRDVAVPSQTLQHARFHFRSRLLGCMFHWLQVQSATLLRSSWIDLCTCLVPFSLLMEERGGHRDKQTCGMHVILGSMYEGINGWPELCSLPAV